MIINVIIMIKVSEIMFKFSNTDIIQITSLPLLLTISTIRCNASRRKGARLVGEAGGDEFNGRFSSHSNTSWNECLRRRPPGKDKYKEFSHILYKCLCSYSKSKIIWKSKFGYCVGKLFHPTEDHHVELYESGVLGITDCISNIAQDIFKKVQVNPLDHTAECYLLTEIIDCY